MVEQRVDDQGQPTGAEVEIVTIPEPPAAGEPSVDVLARMATKAEESVAHLIKLKAAVLKLTNHRDWSIIDGEPYMEVTGAEKVAEIGVRWYSITRRKMTDEDDEGRYYIWITEGTFEIAGRTIEAVGTCSSRDSFFGKRHGERLQESQIDQTNLIKTSYSNAVVNGVTRLLGLRSVSIEELEAAGIDISKLPKVEYGEGTKGGVSPEDRKHQQEIGKLLMEMAQGDEDEARAMLIDFTKFEGDDGEVHVDSLEKLRGKWLNTTLGKVRRAHKKYVASLPEEENQDAGGSGKKKSASKGSGS